MSRAAGYAFRLREIVLVVLFCDLYMVQYLITVYYYFVVAIT